MSQAVKPYNSNLPISTQKVSISYLSQNQLDDLTQAFLEYYEESERYRKARGRLWVVYLFLRYTGARLNEVLSITDTDDIDFRNSEVKIVTLKQKKKAFRTVPIHSKATAELMLYLSQYPEMKGKVFSITGRNFQTAFKKVCQKVNIPDELSHPHILRHTRAVELLRSGVPVTIVQDLLGHSSLNTTAVYLRISAQEAKMILKDKGLI
ncbi:MAG: tyrosine-type recombinase/integrase [Desulfurella sp.]